MAKPSKPFTLKAGIGMSAVIRVDAVGADCFPTGEEFVREEDAVSRADVLNHGWKYPQDYYRVVDENGLYVDSELVAAT